VEILNAIVEFPWAIVEEACKNDMGLYVNGDHKECKSIYEQFTEHKENLCREEKDQFCQMNQLL